MYKHFKSMEALSHYRCGRCDQRWSIADESVARDEITCPYCQETCEVMTSIQNEKPVEDLYCKLPVSIKAIQYTEGAEDGFSTIGEAMLLGLDLKKYKHPREAHFKGIPYVMSPGGTLQFIQEEDYVVTNIIGEKFVISKDEFERTYQKSKPFTENDVRDAFIAGYISSCTPDFEKYAVDVAVNGYMDLINKFLAEKQC